MIKRVLISLLFILQALSCVSQPAGNVYNLNMDRGLFTNHVYSTITDRYGYLWIATANGVVRYNGYDLKIFTTKNGLPVNDVWQLLEDRKGRIWLGAIADKIGYIKNNHYTSVPITTNDYNNIYPQYLSRYDSGIMFCSNYFLSSYQPTLCIEKNDRIEVYNIAGALNRIIGNVKFTQEHINIIKVLLTHDKFPVLYFERKFYICSITRDKIDINPLPYKVNFNDNFLSQAQIWRFDSSIVINNIFKKTSDILVINYNDTSLKTIRVSDDKNLVTLFYHDGSTNNSMIYGISGHFIYEVDLVGKKTKKIGLSDIAADLEGNQINSYVNNDLWKLTIGTRQHGLFIQYDTLRYFRKNVFDLTGFQYKGGDESGGFWYNTATRKFCRVTDNQQFFKLQNSGFITNVAKKDIGRYMILGYSNLIIDVNTKKKCRWNNKKFDGRVQNLVIVNDSEWYTIAGLNLLGYKKKQGIVLEQPYGKEKYANLIFDSTRHKVWAFNRSKIVIVNGNNYEIIQKEKLKQLGLHSIANMRVDNIFGNIFLLGDEQLCLWDPENKKVKAIHENINLADASIAIYHNILITYGRFGFIFNKILGKNKLSPPIFYRNVKNINYNIVSDAQFANGKAIFNTDKGTLTCDIPSQNAFDSPTTEVPDYRLLYVYKENCVQLHNNDTVIIEQDNYNIQFDLINPYGNGQLTYVLQHDNTLAKELNSNEYNFSGLKPDHYYTYSLAAYDKVWRSNQVQFVVYLRPKWYQTNTMVRIIWSFSVLCFVTLVAASVLITRRLVINANQKRNARMELELKSIYAQINPHFIFNSLNSALLLVSKQKTDEAYTHISKFSRLLRSYIKSSRNKHVLLAEEIRNLTNYIDLQQVRFKDRFEYNINVNEDVDINSVYIPSLLLQPFVENAIEHGLLSKEGTGHLLINFIKEQGQLICTIDDDGIGRKESKANKIPNPIKDESYGELLIKDLVNIFNKYEHMNIEVSYTDKQYPQTGTTVTIKIKLNGTTQV